MDQSSHSTTRVAHVSTFPPLRCGIASFVSDLISSSPSVEHTAYSLHYGSTETVGVAGHAYVNSPDSLAKLARTISASNCDVLCLQHEFGIWGGLDGENIHAFLDNLTKPLLSVLHTTFGPGVRSGVQNAIVLRLIQQSNVVVVLTDASRNSVEALCGCHPDRITVVPHGIPDFPYVSPPAIGRTEGGNGDFPLRLVTPGFFRADKGLELILHALRTLVDCGHNISYLIAGEPQRQFEGQAPYLSKVERLIESLELGSVVHIDARYLSVAEQASRIQAAHLGIFGYQDVAQASSGTVPLVMGMGRPVLCTPFEYAKAKAQEGSGVFITNGFDSVAIADAIGRIMRTNDFGMLAKSAYDRTRTWSWATVGATYGDLYRVCAERGITQSSTD